MIFYHPSPREYLGCPDCNLPHGYLEDGHLVIQSRHNGRSHRLRLSPEELREMAERIEKLEQAKHSECLTLL